MVQIALQGIPDIRKVALREAKRIVPSPNAPDGYTNDNEWILDTEGVNLKEVNITTTHSQHCSPLPGRASNSVKLALNFHA
jgi:hypothetical protein